MINYSFSTLISQSEFEENVSGDYLSGFKEKDTEYNLKRMIISRLSPNNSLISERVFDSKEVNEDSSE